MFFPFILICNKKSKKSFNNNLGIRAVIIYFALCLLINDYKNIYSRNVCIIIFHTNCLYNGFLYILLLFKIISYYEKELCVCLEMCEFCRYHFLKSKSIQAKNFQKMRQMTLFTITCIIFISIFAFLL